MKLFGLVGKNISYSFSKKYFTEKFEKENIIDCVYNIFDLKDLSEIIPVFDKSNLIGLNVTIPYKQAIIPYLDNLSEEAKEINAVNTILIKNGGKIGFNTDFYGFYSSIKPLLRQHHKKALILGYGGAAKAVIYGLKQLNIDYKIVSRKSTKDKISYEDINKAVLEEYQIIINCSPVGTFPTIDQAPNIPYQFINSRHLIYDLIYNPDKTKFLKMGKKNGAMIKNGLEMLKLQADKSWEIWNNPQLF